MGTKYKVDLDGNAFFAGNVQANTMQIESFNGGKVLQSNPNDMSTKAIEESNVTSLELSYMSGVTSSIQNQFDQFGSGYFEINDGITHVLTNPMPTTINITDAGSGLAVTLPDMTESNALQANKSGVFYVLNNGNQPVIVRTTTLATLVNIPSGKYYKFTVTDNSTPSGSFILEETNLIISVISPLSINTSLSGHTAGQLSIETNGIDNTLLSQMPAHTFKGNNSASTDNASDLTVSQMIVELSLNQTANQMVYGNGASGITSSPSLTWDNINKILGSPKQIFMDASDLRNNKLSLWGGSAPTDQFYGFGVQAGILRYQVNTASDNHVFYAGTGASSSDELFRIQGNGISLTPASGGIQFGNSTSGYSATTLNYYEDGTFNISLSGPASSGSFSITFSRVGKMVQLLMPNVPGLTSTSATFFSGSAQIPSRLRPAITIDQPIWVIDNSSWQTTPGRLLIGSNGDVSIYKTNQTGNFTASGTCGWGNTNTCYRIA